VAALDREDLDTLATSGLLPAARYAAFLVADRAEGDEVIVGHLIPFHFHRKKDEGQMQREHLVQDSPAK
jgi:hypothetical protein